MLRDLIIIGGGCAGLSAGIYARRYNMNVLLLSEMLGGTITTTHLVENYPGFISVTGLELGNSLIEHAKANDVEFNVGNRVEAVRKNGDIFEVDYGGETFTARSVLLATGTTYRKLGIPGEAEFTAKGVSFCATCDAAFFKNKKVIMVGGGDGAVKESLILAEHAAEVLVVHRGKDFSKAEPINLDRMNKNPKITTRLNTNIVEILGDTVVRKVLFDDGTEFETNGVFIEIGRIPLTSFVDPVGAAKNQKGEIIINSMSETNIPGFYAAGDVSDTPWKQAIVSASEGTKAAYKAFEYVSTFN